MKRPVRRWTRGEKLRKLRADGPRAKQLSLAVSLSTDDDWEVRARAVETLRDNGDSTHLRVAVKALEDVDEVVAATAIECLVEWRVRRLANRISKLLNSPSELLRSYAAWALGNLGGESHVQMLKQRFRVARDEIEGSAVAEALFKLTGQRRYLAHLLAQLRARDPEVRAFTSNSLVGVVDAETFVEVLCSFVRALARERNPVVLGTLRRDVEIGLANALEAIGDPRG